MTIRFSGIRPTPEPGRKNGIVELLNDGRVLLAAGDDGSSSLVSAYLYDPSTDTWTPVGNMTVANRNASSSTPSSVKLLDGRVLVAGKAGSGRNGDLYNPNTQTWTSTTGQHANATTECKLFALPNGTALMLQRSGSLGQHELFTVATQLFSAAPQFPKFPPSAMSYTTIQHSWRAVQLDDGDIIVTGGVRADTSTAGTAMFRYRWSTNDWISLVGLGTARYGHQMCLLKNGKILIQGGITSFTTKLNSAEIYDPETDTISTVTAPHLRRNYGLLVPLDVGDDRILAVSCFGVCQDPDGLITNDTFLNETGDLYDFDEDTWTPLSTVFSRLYQVAGQPHTLLLDGTPIFMNQAQAVGVNPVTESNEVLEFPPPEVAASVTISAIHPSTGFVIGGTTVTIYGSGFTPETQVLFDNVPATDIVVHNDVRLTCKSPEGTLGLTDVTVFNP